MSKSKSSFRKYLTQNLSEKQIQEAMKSLKERGLIKVVDGEPYLTVEGKEAYNKLIEQEDPVAISGRIEKNNGKE
jgi:predicted transcriptional regulator